MRFSRTLRHLKESQEDCSDLTLPELSLEEPGQKTG